MDTLKTVAMAAVGYGLANAAAHAVSDKLPAALAVGGTDLRPYLVGGAALAILAMVAKKYA
jgi:hypothetical protein